MSKLEEVTKPTPILDMIEKRSAIVGGLFRLGRFVGRKLRQRRVDREVEELHRRIFNGEAPSFGKRDEPPKR